VSRSVFGAVLADRVQPRGLGGDGGGFPRSGGGSERGVAGLNTQGVVEMGLWWPTSSPRLDDPARLVMSSRGRARPARARPRRWSPELLQERAREGRAARRCGADGGGPPQRSRRQRPAPRSERDARAWGRARCAPSRGESGRAPSRGVVVRVTERTCSCSAKQRSWRWFASSTTPGCSLQQRPRLSGSGRRVAARLNLPSAKTDGADRWHGSNLETRGARRRLATGRHPA